MKHADHKLLAWIIIFLGASLRLIQYFMNRSLWFDEASLALNIIQRDYSGLLQPLGQNQAAPVLFLIIERFFVTLFGPGELALRLFPLISSLISLPVFYYLLRKISDDLRVTTVSLFLLSFSPLFIYYSSEVKQYSIDVLCCLLLFLFFLDFIKGERTYKKLVILSVIASISVFLSNITVIILGVFFLYFLIEFIRDGRISKPVVMMGLLPAGSFLLYYFFFIAGHPASEYMENFWAKAFMPWNVFSPEFWKWMYKNILNFFITLNHFNDYKKWWLIAYAAFFFILALTGLFVFLVRKNRLAAFLLVTPILLHLILSSFHKYPFHARFILYLYPFVIILIATGLFQFSDKLDKIRWNILPKMILIVATLIIMPVVLVQIFPLKKQEIKDSIDFIKKNSSVNQKVYVFHRGYNSFLYYKLIGYYDLPNEAIAGTKKIYDKQGFESEFEGFNDQVWLLFSHVKPVKKGQTEEIKIVERMKKNRKMIYSHFSMGSSVYLFDKVGP